MDKNIVELSGVNKIYGTNHVVKDLNLTVKEGEFLTLLGSSGCGKTTTLRMIAGFEEPSTGTIQVEGESIEEKEPFERNVNTVFQSYALFPHKTIYDNIAYGPRTHGIRSKAKLDVIVEKSLRDAAIWDEVKDRLKQSAQGLSGGQQQRLCIARALAVEPDILLMDESTSALDPISTGKIEELCVELKRKYTVVMVTHNMQQAVRISDWCAFFLLGDLVEFTPAEVMFSKPEDKRTEDYITGRFG